MAAGILTDALKEFELTLDEIASNLQFVQAASRLRPRLRDMLNWAGMDGGAKELATTFLKQQGVEESLLYRGMTVSLAGAFEQFVRRILRDSILAINKTGADYDALNEALRVQNVFRTGIALQTIFEPLDHLNLDYELLGKNLGTCIRGSKQAILNADAFTIFLSIISPDSLVEAFKRIGVVLQWDDLGRIRQLQDVLQKVNTRETAKSVQEMLKRFGQTRNKIAHTGSSGIAITDVELEQSLTFFRAFARALTSIVEPMIKKHLK